MVKLHVQFFDRMSYNTSVAVFEEAIACFSGYFHVEYLLQRYEIILELLYNIYNLRVKTNIAKTFYS